MTELNYPIKEIRGITDADAEALTAAGMATTIALLSACATRQERQQLAEKTGIAGETILKLANRADLMRVSGIGTKWGDLLEEAGVDTVKELATRNAENLAAKLAEVNAEKNLVGALPTVDACSDWIGQAKALPPRLTY